MTDIFDELEMNLRYGFFSSSWIVMIFLSGFIIFLNLLQWKKGCKFMCVFVYLTQGTDISIYLFLSLFLSVFFLSYLLSRSTKFMSQWQEQKHQEIQRTWRQKYVLGTVTVSVCVFSCVNVILYLWFGLLTRQVYSGD